VRPSRMALVAAAAVVVVTMVTALSGCALAGDPLNGTAWRLTGWSVSSIDPASVTITVAFADGRISGNSGVNSYGGAYSVGIGNTISLGAIAMTEMAGPEPAMRAESAYQALLAQVASFKLSGSTLTFFDKGGNESLIFTKTSR
jgi:heat shock protein HslJ